MAIWAREPKATFSTAPEGLHASVCVDVVDIGLEQTEYGQKYKVQLRWVIEELDPTSGRPFLVVRKFSNTLHKKSILRQTLEMWRGKPFTPSELEGFDLEKLIGVSCQVQIVHNVKADGQTFGNVQAVIPLGKGMTKLAVPQDYTRVRDRDKAQGVGDANGHVPEEEEDPVPF